VNPSVTSRGGISRSVSVKVEISDGDTAVPATKTSTSISHIVGTKTNANDPALSAARVSSSRRRGSLDQCRSPQRMPATIEPTARPAVRVVSARRCGSVSTWAAKSRPPATARVNAVTRPDVVCPVVDRKVTRTGPAMKTSSSTTDSEHDPQRPRVIPGLAPHGEQEDQAADEVDHHDRR